MCIYLWREKTRDREGREREDETEGGGRRKGRGRIKGRAQKGKIKRGQKILSRFMVFKVIYSIWKRDEANIKVIDDMQEY